ncbi:MAG: DUF309 domain-containing protein [Chthoniobacterales bacterium]|nr:DUF309 domain-containing protein [Chthoniobacterales bacterium]
MQKKEKIQKLLSSTEKIKVSYSLSGPIEFLAYISLFERQLYYEAHDALEYLWLNSKNTPFATFYKALIQLAGAFVHLKKNWEYPTHPKHLTRTRPACRLLILAEKNLKPYSFCYGLDAQALLNFVQTYRASIQSKNINPWSPDKAPSLLQFIKPATSLKA